VIDLTTRAWLAREDLDRLIASLREDGRTVIGPTVHDSAIVLDEIGSAADLPIGINDEQSPGRYRIAPAQNGRSGFAFDFASPATSFKSFTYPSTVPISRATRDGDSLTYQ
jgi:sulfhydrogenase subunit beta (sulfur reductase)